MGPEFEPIEGEKCYCDVLGCVNDATFRAKWRFVVKNVCTRHKREIEGKEWPDVLERFGSQPPPK